MRNGTKRRFRNRSLALGVAILIGMSTNLAGQGDKQSRPIPVDSLLAMTFLRELQTLAVTSDGHWLAFTTEDRRRRFVQSGTEGCEGCRVVITNTSSGQLKDVTPHGSSAWSPSWSANGSTLAFFVNDGNGTSLWVWSATSGARRVSQVAFAVNIWAEIRWRPHEDAIVISTANVPIADKTPSTVSVRHDVGSDKPTVEILTSPGAPVSTATAAPSPVKEQIIKLDVRTGKTKQLSGSLGATTVAPDGSKAIYARPNPEARPRNAAQYQRYWDLWLTPFNGEQPVRIAGAVPLAFPLSARVSWSPDGRFIAYRTTGLAAERKVVIVRIESRYGSESIEQKECSAVNIVHQAPLWEADSNAVIFPDGESIQRCGIDGVSRTITTVKNTRLDSVLRRTQDRVWFPIGKKAVWVVGRSTVSGADGIYEVDLSAGKVKTILEEQCEIGGSLRMQVAASDNGGFVIFSAESATEPRDLWI